MIKSSLWLIKLDIDGKGDYVNIFYFKRQNEMKSGQNGDGMCLALPRKLLVKVTINYGSRKTPLLRKLAEEEAQSVYLLKKPRGRISG